MESITIKVEKAFSKEIEKAMKPNYSTKTEFIREAIRDKIKNNKKETALELLHKNFGIGKTKTTDEDLRKAREEVGRAYAKRHGIDLD